MPLPKRLVEPVYVSRGTIPEDFPLPSELEAATNGTLANTVRQLSSLSRHAEDLLGELTRDATQIADRTNSLQARIDRLAVKVTQLDSTVEEVSLQDIHMRKAFKSAVVFDQQIFSRATMPTAMLEIYKTCDRPPPLDKLNCYRDDGKDGLKFYTDPNYFFELWRQEMLKDTERMMHDRGKKPHRPKDSNQTGRHKKRVRQPHNTRERQRQIAVGHGEHIMPQNVQYRTGQSVIGQGLSYNAQEMNQPPPGMVLAEPRPPRPSSIELRRSYPTAEVPDGGNAVPPNVTYAPPYEYGQGPTSSESLYAQSTGTYTPTRRIRPTQPPPAPPASGTPTPSGSLSGTPTRGRSMSTGREQLPPPPPPPETVTSPPPTMNGTIAAHILARSNSNSRSGSPLHALSPSPPRGRTPEPAMIAANDLPPPPPAPEQSPPKKTASPPPVNAAPPPPPPPPPPPALLSNGPIVNSSPPKTISSPQTVVNGDVPLKIMGSSPPKLTPPKDRGKQTAPIVDPRNDLLKAIRDGIKLRKVEKIEQKETERSNALHDVASILARRVAVEFSDSDSASESEYDSDGWGEQETSA